MAKKYLLFAIFLLILSACNKAGQNQPSSEPPEPSSASSVPINTSSEAPVLPDPVEPTSEPSSEPSPEVSSEPCSEAEPEPETDPVPELEEGLGIYEGVIFKYPVADLAGVRHTALYQNYSAITLAIPTDREALVAPADLEALVTAHNGVTMLPDDPPDTLIVLLPLEGYHKMLSSVLGRISDELAPRFERLKSQDLITHFVRFEVQDETFDAVYIYMEGNQVAALTEIETAFIDDLTDVCNLYHDLSGQGELISTPVHFIDDVTGEEYSHLW